MKTQGIILAVTVLVILWWQNSSIHAIAGLYGGSIAVINTILQKWHLLDAAKHARLNAAINLRKAYRCVIERWITTIALLVIGFALLRLSAMSLITGFIVMQLAFIIGNLKSLQQTYGQ